MLNRVFIFKEDHPDPAINCLISWLLCPCTECLARTQLAAKYQRNNPFFAMVIKAIFCLPCMIWQGLCLFVIKIGSEFIADAYEIKRIQEVNPDNTYNDQQNHTSFDHFSHY